MTTTNITTGIYKGMRREAYEPIPAHNPSRIKAVLKSLKHYQHLLQNPKSQTPAMLLGSAMHTAILEPDEFVLRYVIWDGAVKRGGEWTAFKSANEGRSILDREDYETCLAMRDAVRACPEAMGIITRCPMRETPIVWEDPATGLPCKGIPDLFGPATLTDIKTTNDVTPRKFNRVGGDFGYHVSAGAYLDGLECNGYPINDVTMIAVESKAPFDVVIYTIPDEVKSAGRNLWRDCLKRIKFAMDADCWPGVGEAGAIEFRPYIADDSEELTFDGEAV